MHTVIATVNYTGGGSATATVYFIVTKRLGVPPDGTPVHETFEDEDDGEITGIEEGMEFSDDNGNTWRKVTQDEIDVHKGRLAFAALLLVFLTAGAIAAINLISAQGGYDKARNEYDALRRYAPEVISAPASASGQEIPAQDALLKQAEAEPRPDLSGVNPDYIGWIRIERTNIDYPIVQGADNDKYMGVTFGGEKNASGAIFMDYRFSDKFDGAFTVIYGHRMNDGSMFSDLNLYLEDGYLDAHPEITIYTAGGETLTYRIFAARETGVRDPLYALHSQEEEIMNDYMASLGTEGANRYIALSTCTEGSDEERLLVIGATPIEPDEPI